MRGGGRSPNLIVTMASRHVPNLPASCKRQDCTASSRFGLLSSHAGSPAIREKLGVAPGASDAEAFGAIRSAKDTFR